MRGVKHVVVTINGTPSEEALQGLANEIVRQYLEGKTENKENDKQS